MLDRTRRSEAQETLLRAIYGLTLSQEQAALYAPIIKNVGANRNVTLVGLTADEKFAERTSGRLLVWQPATGEFRERSSRKFWPFS